MALVMMAPAQAQISINEGRTPSQIYAVQCGPCHERPQELTKAPPARLVAFLGEHYTESRETAVLLADYLLRRASNAPEPRVATPRRSRERPAADEAGQAESRATAGSPDQRGGDRAGRKRQKPQEAKPTDSGGARGAAPVEPVAAPAAFDAKPFDAKPVDAKPVETESVDAPAVGKPADASLNKESPEEQSSGSRGTGTENKAVSSEEKPEAALPQIPAAKSDAADTKPEAPSAAETEARPDGKAGSKPDTKADTGSETRPSE
ncbi:MAG TPA: hypothetical protein VNQ56_03065 [Pseudolabrys sp.]|nr:hypothetical protein [Pseudolabrys sp.]